MPAFSQRQGYDLSKGIAFREELPTELRPPIIEVLLRYVSDTLLIAVVKKIFNPDGITHPPPQTVPIRWFAARVMLRSTPDAFS